MVGLRCKKVVGNCEGCAVGCRITPLCGGAVLGLCHHSSTACQCGRGADSRGQLPRHTVRGVKRRNHLLRNRLRSEFGGCGQSRTVVFPIPQKGAATAMLTLPTRRADAVLTLVKSLAARVASPSTAGRCVRWTGVC